MLWLTLGSPYPRQLWNLWLGEPKGRLWMSGQLLILSGIEKNPQTYFQAFAMKMRTALLGISLQREEEISDRRFGTIYRSPLQGLRILQNPQGFLTSEDGTGKLSRNVGNKLPLLAAQYPIRAQFSNFRIFRPQVSQYTDWATAACCLEKFSQGTNYTKYDLSRFGEGGRWLFWQRGNT